MVFLWFGDPIGDWLDDTGVDGVAGLMPFSAIEPFDLRTDISSFASNTPRSN
jgi:hypothetical protein